MDDPKPQLPTDGADSLFRDCTAYYLHQNTLIWSSVQTFIAIQSLALAGGYLLRDDLCLSLGAVALGMLLSWFLYLLWNRHAAVRDANRELLLTLGQRLAARHADASGEPFSFCIRPEESGARALEWRSISRTRKWSDSGTGIFRAAFLTLIVTDVAMALLLISRRLTPIEEGWFMTYWWVPVLLLSAALLLWSQWLKEFRVLAVLDGTGTPTYKKKATKHGKRFLLVAFLGVALGSLGVVQQLITARTNKARHDALMQQTTALTTTTNAALAALKKPVASDFSGIVALLLAKGTDKALPPRIPFVCYLAHKDANNSDTNDLPVLKGMFTEAYRTSAKIEYSLTSALFEPKEYANIDDLNGKSVHLVLLVDDPGLRVTASLLLRGMEATALAPASAESPDSAVVEWPRDADGNPANEGSAHFLLRAP